MNLPQGIRCRGSGSRARSSSGGAWHERASRGGHETAHAVEADGEQCVSFATVQTLKSGRETGPWHSCPHLR